jgi:hypothetical protein
MIQTYQKRIARKASENDDEVNAKHDHSSSPFKPVIEALMRRPTGE